MNYSAYLDFEKNLPYVTTKYELLGIFPAEREIEDINLFYDDDKKSIFIYFKKESTFKAIDILKTFLDDYAWEDEILLISVNDVSLGVKIELKLIDGYIKFVLNNIKEGNTIIFKFQNEILYFYETGCVIYRIYKDSKDEDEYLYKMLDYWKNQNKM